MRRAGYVSARPQNTVGDAVFTLSVDQSKLCDGQKGAVDLDFATGIVTCGTGLRCNTATLICETDTQAQADCNAQQGMQWSLEKIACVVGPNNQAAWAAQAACKLKPGMKWDDTFGCVSANTPVAGDGCHAGLCTGTVNASGGCEQADPKCDPATGGQRALPGPKHYQWAAAGQQGKGQGDTGGGGTGPNLGILGLDPIALAVAKAACAKKGSAWIWSDKTSTCVPQQSGATTDTTTKDSGGGYTGLLLGAGALAAVLYFFTKGK